MSDDAPDLASDGEGYGTGMGEATDRSLLWEFRIPLALIALVFVLRPVVAHEWVLGYGNIATTILIWMIFVAGFNLLLGFTGVLSFGHAMFLGIGMYSTAIGLSKFGIPWFLGTVIGLVATAAVAFGIGKIIAEKGEIYFAMLTIAFGEAFYYVVNQNPGGLTEGSDGISSNTLPAWILADRGDKFVSFVGIPDFDWYWLVAIFFVVATVGLWQLLRSPFGRTLRAIRENEELARAMGIDTTRYKVYAFTISALFASLAGSLLEINDQGAVLETFHWTTSGDAVLMSVLGGMNYFAGPFAGVFVWLGSEDYLTDFELLQLPLSEFALVTLNVEPYMEHWKFLLGLLFVLIILSSPREGCGVA
ncbi:branched-chain amino acid ABC transporter permease [Haloarchaeobius sp. HME9146]|uniref:branched-chain amino acid ABC transporter permease n=1 Tax=Haloarchaeobius sp. HME9146 TaxID=2978732 RepID=UPI0021C0074E|nr:branched-chain amino acid ABC transporter permease [Haloarchaeobius sp. HME9146]MCT9097821.1 branched-chain amino acid ABC transporter permease [Haloarchaeobius sp. HME9146]